MANNPENEADGTRKVPFTGELWIEQDDFREVPPPKYFRLSPGREVRLRGAYLVTAETVVKDDAGNIVEVRCSYDPDSRGGTPADGRKVKSTMHWVSAPHALGATVALYDRLSVPRLRCAGMVSGCITSGPLAGMRRAGPGFPAMVGHGGSRAGHQPEDVVG